MPKAPRYINVDDLLDHADDLERYCGTGAKDGLQEIIKMCPIVDATPRTHAHRKIHIDIRSGRKLYYWTCSNCGVVSVTDGNYCPKCGAKFDEVTE